MRHIAVLTSGGDAPGMNAAVRAVVRTAITEHVKVSGIYRGYQGLIEDEIVGLGARGVANIIQRGGTVLRTARSETFRKPEGRELAAKIIKRRNIDGLIVIGGDGSFKGASALMQEHGIPAVGIPATIDNDIYGTDQTIGFDTALGIAVEAVDRLRDTAASHDRLFIVEVMGRNAGHIALSAGVAGGAEAILVPEIPVDMQKLIERLHKAHDRGKNSIIVVVAEGAYPGGAAALEPELKGRIPYDARAVNLGHTQRGGSPSSADRILASRFGYFAVKRLLHGEPGVMVGTSESGTVYSSINDVVGHTRDIDRELLAIAQTLSI